MDMRKKRGERGSKVTEIVLISLSRVWFWEWGLCHWH